MSELIILIIFGLIISGLIFIKRKLSKGRKKVVSHRQYKKRIKNNLKKIRYQKDIKRQNLFQVRKGAKMKKKEKLSSPRLKDLMKSYAKIQKAEKYLGNEKKKLGKEKERVRDKIIKENKITIPRTPK